MNTPTPTPIHKTPAFWRRLAAEWREEIRISTQDGICAQLICKLGFKDSLVAENFLHEFDPTHGTRCYFFPLGDRTSRAELCDHIANTLEHEANQTSTAQA